MEGPVEDFLADVRKRFYDEVDTTVHPMPGLFVLLDSLQRLKCPSAVATSSGHAYAERLLVRHGLESRFAFVLAAEDVKLGKPDPEIYQLAAHRFGVPARSMLVLEDSPAGLAAARSAEAFAVGIPHEHSPVEALQAADLIVTRLDDPSLLHLIASRDGMPLTDEPLH